MSTIRTKGGLHTELPVITRRELDAYIREGRRLRAEETNKLLRAAGRGLARLGRAVAGLAGSGGRDASTRAAARGSRRDCPSGGFGQPTRA